MILIKDSLTCEKYPLSCVYWIYHEDKHTDILTSGYVGVSANGAATRFSQHRCDAKTRPNNPVHKAISKYGDKMKCKVILLADPELCLLLEGVLRPMPKIGYNLAAGGGDAPMLGRKHTDETKLKMCGRTGEKSPVWGKEHSRETKDKIGAANTGRVKPEKERQAISERTSGERNPFYGKTHSAETLAYIVEINTGKEVSIATRERMSASRLGRKHSDESLRKMSKDGLLKSERPTKRAGWKMNECQKKEFSDLQRLKFRLPWNVPRCNHTVWSKAGAMFDYHLENPTHKATALGNHFGLVQSSVTTMLNKFKSGWNPRLDVEYIEWLNNLNNKEIEYVAQAA